MKSNIELSTQEVTNILCKYFNDKGYNAKEVVFKWGWRGIDKIVIGVDEVKKKND